MDPELIAASLFQHTPACILADPRVNAEIQDTEAVTAAQANRIGADDYYQYHSENVIDNDIMTISLSITLS